MCCRLQTTPAAILGDEYYNGWTRVLKVAGVPHIGTHGIRHRSATDIANSGVPIKVGMALTAHNTVAIFMRYVHTEDDCIPPVHIALMLLFKEQHGGERVWGIAGSLLVEADGIVGRFVVEGVDAGKEQVFVEPDGFFLDGAIRVFIFLYNSYPHDLK